MRSYIPSYIRISDILQFLLSISIIKTMNNELNLFIDKSNNDCKIKANAILYDILMISCMSYVIVTYLIQSLLPVLYSCYKMFNVIIENLKKMYILFVPSTFIQKKL